MTMRGVVQSIPLPAGTGTGEARNVLELIDMVVALSAATGTPTGGSIQLEGSFDGATFFNVGSAMTAKGDFVEVTTPKRVKFLRANVASTPAGGTYKLEVFGTELSRG